jgi:tRNA(Ile)-lysidine synthetase-like protein
MSLSAPLLRRALWRLLTEGTGHAPGRRLLDLLIGDLGAGRCRRHSLPGHWSLVLRSARLLLIAPPPSAAATRAGLADPDQTLMPWGDPEPVRHYLPLPGIVALPDGRRISAELEPAPPTGLVPRGDLEVLVDARALNEPLTVRTARPGDRFHPLGAPGSRPLVRFLADAGVPREERGSIPLVVSAGRIIWVAGLRPADPARVRPDTKSVVRLVLHAASAARQDEQYVG